MGLLVLRVCLSGLHLWLSYRCHVTCEFISVTLSLSLAYHLKQDSEQKGASHHFTNGFQGGTALIYSVG